MSQHHLLPPLCNLLSCQSGIHSPTSHCSSPPCLAVMAQAEFRAERCPKLHNAHTSRAGVASCSCQCPLILPLGICFLLENTPAVCPGPGTGTGTHSAVLMGLPENTQVHAGSHARLGWSRSQPAGANIFSWLHLIWDSRAAHFPVGTGACP